MADAERALNHRDFDRFATMFAPEFMIVEHQPFGLTMDREVYLENLRLLTEQTPSSAFVFAKPYIVGSVVLTPVPFVGTTPEGSRYEWSSVQLGRVDEAGRVHRFEHFADDQWELAVARFDELVAEEQSPNRAARGDQSIENMASRLTAEAARGFGVDGRRGRSTAPTTWCGSTTGA